MTPALDRQNPFGAHRCCGCPTHVGELSRRGFLGTSVLGGTVLTGLSWTPTSGAEADLPAPPPRRPLVVKPVLTYDTPTRQPQTSWRSWGGIQTEAEAQQEAARIASELDELKAKADYPVTFLPLAAVHGVKALEAVADVKDADAILLYAAGGGIDGIEALKKPTIVFLRHQSGPVSLWYEIVSPRFLRQHTDTQKQPAILPDDVVVDRLDEVAWRLRSLCGLANTVGQKILTIGGAGAWAQPGGIVPELVKKLWKLDIQDVPYDELAPLVKAARADTKAVALAKARAEAYVKLPGTTVETDTAFIENAFLLEQVFRKLMADAGTRFITINMCMGTIMGVSETTACLPLSTLNDAGYYAFCESDFVVIPSGMLLGAISGKPTFLNDPTYPHDGIITLAHCTAPRKLDGQTLEPVRILTHFESDYGAAPKVEMKAGTPVTNIIPDFKSERWVGFLGTIADSPFLPICRSQIEVKFTCDSARLAERMPGFHWMTGYGDYRRELGYALRRIPISWECLDEGVV